MFNTLLEVGMGFGESATDRFEALRKAAALPEVGALVEVTLVGRVAGVHESQGFYIQSGTTAFDTYSYWVPADRPVKLLSSPRPREVLLLECGHVSPGPCPPYAESIWCGRCQKKKQLTAVGSVTW